MRPRRIMMTVLVLLPLVLSACGGGPAAATPGPSPTPEPTATPIPPEFGTISFGIGIVGDEDATRTSTTFPEGIHKIYASWDYTDMPEGVEWRREWYWDGALQEGVSVTENWSLDEHGTTWINISDDEDGLGAGDYELRLFIDGQQVQSGTFEIVERRPDVPIFKPITFALAVTEEYDAIDPAITFTGAVTTVHGVFDVENLAAGTSFDRAWFWNGEEILRSTEPIEDPEQTVYDVALFVDQGTLDPGTYTLELYFNDEMVQGGSFTITSE